jgi:hypothetical protein
MESKHPGDSVRPVSGGDDNGQFHGASPYSWAFGHFYILWLLRVGAVLSKSRKPQSGKSRPADNTSVLEITGVFGDQKLLHPMPT